MMYFSHSWKEGARRAGFPVSQGFSGFSGVFGVRKGSPLYVAEKVTNPYGFVLEKAPILRASKNPENRKRYISNPPLSRGKKLPPAHVKNEGPPLWK
jgi:hypothetical protein